MIQRRWLLFALVVVWLLAACGGDEGPATTTPVSLDPLTGGEAAIDGDATAVSPTIGAPEASIAAPGGTADGTDAEAGGAAGVIDAAVVTTPLPAPTYLEPPPSPHAPGSTVLHTVSRGEWLHQITRCYGADYSAVRAANPHIYYPDWIYPGTRVTVPNVGSAGAIIGAPCVQTYVVQAGDTWEGLATRFATTAFILQRANPGALTTGRALVVPTTAPATGELPTLSHDLVFIYDGDLAVWQSSDGRVAVYQDESATILDLATNSTGDKVLVRQTTDGSAEEIALIYMVPQTITVVETGLAPLDVAYPDPNRSSLLLSPNGDWAAYMVANGGSWALHTFAAAQPDTIHTTPADHPGQAQAAPQLFPDNDPANLLLLDNGGIYRYDYALTGGEELIYDIPDDPLADANGLGVYLFTAVSWSPNNELLLLDAGFLEGGASFAWDPATNTLAAVPESGGYITLAATAWADVGQLLVASPPQTGSGITLAYYQAGSSGGVLALDEIQSNLLTAANNPLAAAPGFVILGADSYQPGSDVALAVQTGATAGLYRTDSNGPLTLVTALPGDFNRTVWAPDASGLLLELYGPNAAAGSVTYVAANGSSVYPLSAWLGAAIGDFHWVTP